MVNVLFTCAMEQYFSSSIIRKALNEIKPDKCFMILGDKKQRDLFAEFGKCFFREDVASGIFSQSDIDLASAVPLDDGILRAMAPYCVEILTQQRRFEEFHAFHISDTYECHYTIYMRNLFFWNNLMEKEHITHVFMSSIPHEGYDSVIYHLCKIKGIPVRMIYNTTIPFRVYPLSDYLDVDKELKPEYCRLKELYQNVDIDEIPLEGETEKIFAKWASLEPEQMKPWNMRVDPLKRRFEIRFGNLSLKKEWWLMLGQIYVKYDYKPSVAFLAEWVRNLPEFVKAINIVRKRSKYAAPVWKRTLELNQFYDSLAEMPVPGEKYVYFPLHYQPEASSNPLDGGFYSDQILVLNILSRSLPEDVCIYVKNHPEQLAPMRSREYYSDMHEIDKVKFIKMECSTYDLIKNAFAVASLTGTACWEAQFYSVPALLFGYSQKNLAPLSYCVRTLEECKKAVAEIGLSPRKDVRKELKILTKAMHNISFSVDEIEEVLPAIMTDFMRKKYDGEKC